jgi:hypothetical protein
METMFTAIDLSGVHQVDLTFCGCGDENGLHVSKNRQLLRFGWYPASHQRPQTAFTFDFLDTYHKLSLQGKLNLYDFYTGILQKTNNRGGHRKIVRVNYFVAVSSLTAF